MGWAKTEDVADDPTRQTQRTVCFSETPLEHVPSLFAEIEGRQIQLQPYGLVLTKIVARTVGVNPVWYVDMTTRGGRDWEEARAVDEIRNAAIAGANFHQSPAAKILPFFECMGTWPLRRKEFWWEREWRHRGDLDLAPIWGKIIWLCPEAEHERFRASIHEVSGGEARDAVILDASWGIEHIVAHLSGLAADDVSLFHASAARSQEDGVIRSSHAA